MTLCLEATTNTPKINTDLQFSAGRQGTPSHCQRSCVKRRRAKRKSGSLKIRAMFECFYFHFPFPLTDCNFLYIDVCDCSFVICLSVYLSVLKIRGMCDCSFVNIFCLRYGFILESSFLPPSLFCSLTICLSVYLSVYLSA